MNEISSAIREVAKEVKFFYQSSFQVQSKDRKCPEEIVSPNYELALQSLL